MNDNTKNMPNNGNLLKRYLNDSNAQTARLTRKMGYSSMTLYRLMETYSIKTHYWWELGLALNRNIFAELGERFPVDYKTKRERELEAELSDVKKEVEIYKSILNNRR